MKLADLGQVQDLAAKLKVYRDAFEKCSISGVAGWGDWWFIEYNYEDDHGPKNRLRIPVEIAREFVVGQIAKYIEELRRLGVEA